MQLTVDRKQKFETIEIKSLGAFTIFQVEKQQSTIKNKKTKNLEIDKSNAKNPGRK